jgi:hypothetical protein
MMAISAVTTFEEGQTRVIKYRGYIYNFDCNGVVHHELIPPSQNVNQQYYTDVLQHVLKWRSVTCWFKTMWLFTQHCLSNGSWPRTVSQPTPYPPKLSVSILAMRLKGNIFNYILQIQKNSQAALHSIMEEEFQHATNEGRSYRLGALTPKGSILKGT